MADPFVGEIRMFAGNFAPRGWAGCEGQLLAVSQNDALFSLLGTQYGGDGRTTFGLPDLRGRVPIHFGNGPGLSPRQLGGKGGTESVTLTENQLPPHSHAQAATVDVAGRADPSAALPAARNSPLYGGVAMPVPMENDTVASVGGGQPHPNVQPFLCITFIIALFGIYPSRS